MGKHVFFELAGVRFAARFDGDRDDGKRLAAVQYVRFPVGADGEKTLADVTKTVALVIDHPNYQHRLELNEAQRRSLAHDLA